MLADSDGAALRRVRMLHPACGNCAAARSRIVARPASVGFPGNRALYAYSTRLPGCTRPEAVSPSSETSSRGAKPKPSDAASGSVTSLARSSKVAVPSLTSAPGAMPSRSNIRSGAAAPYTPSTSPNKPPRGSAGSVTSAPNSG